MATSITHEDVKPRIGVASATTTYDTEIDTVCTAVAAGVDAAVDSAYLTSAAALVKLAAIDIATGTLIIGILNRPGYAEQLAAAGVTLGGLDKDGAKELIKTGWATLAPYRQDRAAATAAAEAAKTQAADSAECDSTVDDMVFAMNSAEYGL
ncbi:MAG: hypothetical protein B7Z62_00210 [Deltaproteobacteria bacterium 37-65-8]|nr:MAG: hypothetical protein B7Z62_00210 [Deltaproteobacteria bacterium 37-65-8]